MILAIDCGNSRIKWGLRAPGDAPETWRAAGARPTAEIDALAADWAAIAPPACIAIANVAGESARAGLVRALSGFSAEPRWVIPQARQCGVANGYDTPSQLGADRWVALIGARRLHPGAALVVHAGTATTVDLLGADGRFRGGVILPGLDLMKRALAEHTAGLPLARGCYADPPRNTADAIETGCVHAQAGAIERMYARLEPGAIALLSGGGAPRIAEYLSMPRRVVGNLALEGLVCVAS